MSVLSVNNLKRIELKGIALLLIVLSNLIMAIYCFIGAFIKYREGYYVDPITGLIITRPREKYDEKNRVLFPSISVLLNLSWTLQTSGLFLVLSLWNHMSKAMLNKQFMASWEFKAYAIYSIFSMIVYPFLQIAYFLTDNIVVSALLPLLVYNFQCLILLGLSQLANSRFKKVLEMLPSASVAYCRIEYYARLNNFLAFCLLINIVGLASISIDSLTTDKLYYNKFLLDFFTKLYNVGMTLSFPLVALILCPRTENYEEVKTPYSPGSPYSADTRQTRMSRLQSPLSEYPPQPQTPLSPSSDKRVVRDTRGYFKVQDADGRTIREPERASVSPHTMSKFYTDSMYTSNEM
ncbi:hypothetical protein MP638_007425 [Amoeboaphelidium occidentale]|nr:hypothetical protein MP638_007425 [Amoeboaphelidium occidentale]